VKRRSGEFGDFAALWLLKLISGLLQALPLKLALGLGAWVGRLAYRVRSRKGVSYLNLKAAFEGVYSPREMRRIAGNSFANFGRSVAEILRFPKMDQRYIDAHVRVPHVKRIDEALAKGKGLIFLTAHFGNWELLSVISCFYRYPLKVLARDQKPKRLNEFLNGLRTYHGAEQIGKGASVRELIRALRNGSVVGVVGDQGSDREGVPVKFLGRITTAPPGPIAIAQRTGCAVLPVFSVRENGTDHLVHVLPEIKIYDASGEPLPIREKLQEYYSTLEAFVRRYPDHWLWEHKRWKHCFTKTFLFLCDGKAGHESSLKAVADILGEAAEERGCQFRFKFQPVRYRSAWHRFALTGLCFFLRPWIRGRLAWLRFFLKDECWPELASCYADFTVSCGSSLLPVHAWVARENKAKTVVLMKPPFPFRRSRYDLVIAPRHDAPVKARHVLYTEMMPNLVTEKLLCAEGERLKNEQRLADAPYVSFFVGGDTRDYALRRDKIGGAIEKLLEVSRESRFKILLTTSRRTRTEIECLIKEKCGSGTSFPLVVIANEKNIPNVSYGMLGLSRAVFVTEDSVAMISEAVCSGRPVFVLKAGTGNLPEKHRRFQENLSEKGLVRILDPIDISGSCFVPGRSESKGAELSREIREGIKEKILKIL